MTDLVLVTGAAGTLGSALLPMLLDEGHDVRAVDLQVPSTAGADIDWLAVDLRDADAVAAATRGVTLAVHGAAWHGIHLADHPPRDFWELNVDGTFNLYEACAANGTRAVVFSSTMGVYGKAGVPAEGSGAIRIHERLVPQPTDIYGASKLVGEELGAMYARSRGVAGAALRYGMFVPEPFGHYGVRMLYGGVDERDVAKAVIAALERSDAGLPYAAYNIMSSLPFTPGDADELRTDLMAVVRRHWPDAEPLMERAEAVPWGPVNNWYDISLAERDLGWRPRWNFTEFLAAVREGITEAAAIPPAPVGTSAADAPISPGAEEPR